MPALVRVVRWALGRAGGALTDVICRRLFGPGAGAPRGGRFRPRADGYGSRGEAVVASWLRTNMPDVVFRKVRPDWLRNPRTGQNLELDFYCDDLQLGIEVQGDQHYKYVPAFHRRGVRDFQSQCARDTLKRKLCRTRGVALVEVPGWVTLLPEQLDSHLRTEIDRALGPGAAMP